MLVITHGNYRVMRACCTSAICLDCKERGTHGDMSKRALVVQLDGLSKVTADQVAANWALYDAVVEQMP